MLIIIQFNKLTPLKLLFLLKIQVARHVYLFKKFYLLNKLIKRLYLKTDIKIFNIGLSWHKEYLYYTFLISIPTFIRFCLAYSVD